MSPQRKSVQGNVPQRRLVHLDTRTPRATAPVAKASAPALVSTPVPAPMPQVTVNRAPQTLRASKPFVAQVSAPAPILAKPVHQQSVAVPKQTSHVTAVPQKPRPFHQKLPSAADLAALTQKAPTQTQQQHRSRPVAQQVSVQPQAQHVAAKQVLQSQRAVRTSTQQPRPMRPRQQHAASDAPKPLFEQAINAERTKQAGGKRPRNRAQIAFMTAGVVVFIIGIAVSIMSLHTNHQVAAQAKTLTQAASSDDGVNLAGNGDDPQPSEAPVPRATVAAYKVAPDAPRKLIIPKLGVDTRVLGMGLKADGDLQTPNNIYDTGWYSNSAKPGAAGATLIDGHVHGLTAPGVFYNLKKLSKDDVILVERGDGKQIKYKVVKTQVYDATTTDMKAAVTPVVAGKSGLNLITCTGKVNLKTSTYNERLLVFATIVE